MESCFFIKATPPEMRAFFKSDFGVRFYEICDTRYSHKEIENMPDKMYNSTAFRFSIRYRHSEIKKEFTGLYTISGFKKALERRRKEFILDFSEKEL